MTMTTERTIRNGIDTTTYRAEVDLIRETPEAGQARFTAKNRWMSGAHSRSTMFRYAGLGEAREHVTPFHADADAPTALAGTDQGPTPHEWLLHAVAADLTTNVVTIAAERGVHLDEVVVKVDGDLDLNGSLGLNDQIRNGFQQLRLRIELRGDVPADELREIVATARARSAVLDVVTHGTCACVDVAVC
jgi:uncharacterized OsmC-like protein